MFVVAIQCLLRHFFFYRTILPATNTMTNTGTLPYLTGVARVATTACNFTSCCGAHMLLLGWNKLGTS